MPNIYTKNRGTSSKYPTPPRPGSVRDGIVMAPRPTGEATVGLNSGARDIANYGALGAGLAHKPGVGVPLAAGVAAADTYDANRATTNLRQQTAHSDAYFRQPTDHEMIKARNRDAWDATYDDPRRANPPTFSNANEEAAFYEEISRAEEARHPIRRQHRLALDRDIAKAKEHKQALTTRQQDFEKYNKRALQNAVVLGTFGVFDAAHPTTRLGKAGVGGLEAGVEMGGKYGAVPFVMEKAGARGDIGTPTPLPHPQRKNPRIVTSRDLEQNMYRGGMW